MIDRQIKIFSVIIPIYKVENYIERCVDSVCHQTLSNIEIILVDDGSPDRCPEICDIYAQNDSRIKVIHKANGGLSDARNAGISAATGEYVILLDSDDYIEEDACEKLSEYVVNCKCDILIGDAIVHDGEAYVGHTEVLYNKCISGYEYLRVSARLNKTPMAAWLNVYRREFLIENNLKFKKSILHEDEQFTPRALLLAKSVVYTKLEFYHYIIRENSITTLTDKRKNCADIYSTCIELESIYRALPDCKLKRRLLSYCVNLYLSVYAAGNIYRYDKSYTHRMFVLRNAKKIKTFIKALVFVVSPTIYCKINHCMKKVRGK